jgi:hypothetical protein
VPPMVAIPNVKTAAVPAIRVLIMGVPSLGATGVAG